MSRNHRSVNTMGRKASAVAEDEFYSALMAEPTPTPTLQGAALDLSFVPRRLQKRMSVTVPTRGRFRIAFRDPHGVSDFYRALADSDLASEIDLETDPTLFSFSPPDNLLQQSENPLWVLRPMDSNTIMIERAWK